MSKKNRKSKLDKLIFGEDSLLDKYNNLDDSSEKLKGLISHDMSQSILRIGEKDKNGSEVEPVPKEKLEEFYQTTILPRIEKNIQAKRKREKEIGKTPNKSIEDLLQISDNYMYGIKSTAEIFAGDEQITDLIRPYQMNDSADKIIYWLSEHLESYSAMEKFKEILDNPRMLESVAKVTKHTKKESTFVKYISAMQKDIKFADKMDQILDLELDDTIIQVGSDLFNTYGSLSMMDSYLPIVSTRVTGHTYISLVWDLGLKNMQKDSTKSVIKKFEKSACTIDEVMQYAFNCWMKSDTSEVDYDKWIERLSKDTVIEKFDYNPTIAMVVCSSLKGEKMAHTNFLNNLYGHRNLLKIATIFAETFNEKPDFSDFHQKELLVMVNYLENDYVIDGLAKNPSNEKVYDALSTDKVFQRIQEDPSYFYVVSNAKYVGIIKDMDSELVDKIGADDLNKVYKALELVKEIHSERSSEHLDEIEAGFYQQLHRSIAQGSDYKSKLQCLRKYCADVHKLMDDNLEELMVMTNA